MVCIKLQLRWACSSKDTKISGSTKRYMPLQMKLILNCWLKQLRSTLDHPFIGLFRTLLAKGSPLWLHRFETVIRTSTQEVDHIVIRRQNPSTQQDTPSQRALRAVEEEHSEEDDSERDFAEIPSLAPESH